MLYSYGWRALEYDSGCILECIDFYEHFELQREHPTFQMHFLDTKCLSLFQYPIWLKFIPEDAFDNKAALVRLMAWWLQTYDAMGHH